MFSAVRNRFGTAGLIVAVVALVAALAGGAYAASGGLTGKQKKEVKKIAKQYAGKRGPKGAAGAQGPAGPTGPQGPAGDKGAAGEKGATGADGTNGETGATGADGTNGESVQINAYSGSECAEAPGEAGVELTNGSGTSYVCTGKQGPEGTTGFSPTLPAGASESGSWVSPYFHGHYTALTESVPVQIVFPFPLPEGETVHYKYMKYGETPTEECPGSATEPTAKEGYLCVYRGSHGTNTNEEKIATIGNGTNPDTGTATSTVGRFGYSIPMYEPSTGEGKATFATGTWALTVKP